MSFSPNRFPHVVADPDEVGAALIDVFGLPRFAFERAVLEGDLERRRTVADDAPGADGYYAYTRTLRTLRRESRREGGWHRGSHRAIPVTFDSTETLAITPSSGDEHTGRIGADPSTKNIKGGDAAAAIDANIQLAYDEFRPFDAPVDFFYLLYAPGEDGVYAEVSQPTYQDASGYVTGWGTRFILGRVGGEEQGPMRRPIAEPSAPVAPIDVTVERKSS